MKSPICRAAAAFCLSAWMLASFSGCKKDTEPLSRTEFHLDTTAVITLYDWSDEGTLDRAMDEISRLEALLSSHMEGSDPERLSAAAGEGAVPLDRETLSVLETAQELSDLTDGAFDVTAGPLIDAWDIRDGGGHIPSEEALREAMALTDYRRLLLSKDGASLETPGMRVDLGAIGKGYISDRVADLLRAEGVTSAVISLGGNVVLIGGKPDGSDFRVGVRDPLGNDSSLAAIARGQDEVFVTSGIYERYFEKDGVRYHHVLDPATGYPSDSGLAGVTILAKNAALADGLSTACLILGQEKALALIRSIPDAEALLITTEGEQIPTEGFADRLIGQ